MRHFLSRVCVHPRFHKRDARYCYSIPVSLRLSVCLSVRPFVCPRHSIIVSKRLHILYRNYFTSATSILVFSEHIAVRRIRRSQPTLMGENNGRDRHT